jgi:putative FmdB family regulatory protein
MPIYEYECSKCGQKIEVLQKMTDKPLKKHAGCGGSLTKLISAAGFQFKGTGWYVTDYARKESKTETKEIKETKETKETSSNGNKEGSSGRKAGAETAGKKDSASKTGGKKE